MKGPKVEMVGSFPERTKIIKNICTKPNGAASGLFESSNAQSQPWSSAGLRTVMRPAEPQHIRDRSSSSDPRPTMTRSYPFYIIGCSMMFHDLERLHAFIWNLIRTISDILFAGAYILKKVDNCSFKSTRSWDPCTTVYYCSTLPTHLTYVIICYIFFIMVIWSRVHTVWACGIWSKARPDRECPLWTCTLSASVCVGLSRFRGVSGWECA